MTLDLYYVDLSPPCRASLFVAKTLGVDVNLKRLNIFKMEQMVPEYLKINPNHTVPTLVDDGFSLFESRAIMVYLVNKYHPNSNLYPQDLTAKAKVDQVLYYDASALFPAIRAFVKTKIFMNQEPDQETSDTLKEKIAVFERLLDGNKFLAGNELTLADISLAVTIPFLERFVNKDWIPEKLHQWIERVYKALPLMKQFNEEFISLPMPDI